MKTAYSYRPRVASPFHPAQVPRKKAYDTQDKKHPAREEISKCLGSHNITAVVEEDMQTLTALQHVEGLVAFLVTITRDGKAISQGRGSAVLNPMNRFISRTVASAFNSALADAVIRATRVLDTLRPKTEGEDGKVLFERTQKQLAKNFEDSKRNKVNSYLLAERIRCECGCSRTGEGPQKGKYLYYRCSSRVKSFPLPATCKEKGINARIADEKVWNRLVQLASSKELILSQLQRWKLHQNGKAGASGVSIEALQQEVVKLKKQEQRYQMAYGEGAIEIAQLTELTTPLKARIIDLEKQIAKERTAVITQTDNSILSDDEVNKLQTSTVLLMKDLSFEQKRDIVLDVVEEIVGVPGRLRVSGHLPVAVVSPFQYDFHFPSAINTYVELKISDRNCWIA